MNALLTFFLAVLLCAAACAALCTVAWYAASAVAWSFTWPRRRGRPTRSEDDPWWPFPHMPDAAPYRGTHRRPR